MSKNGGYLIIDLSGLSFTSNTPNLNANWVFDILKENDTVARRKRVILSGLKIGTTYYPDVEIKPTYDSVNISYNFELNSAFPTGIASKNYLLFAPPAPTPSQTNNEVKKGDNK